MRNNKGISAVVATVLIILITVAAVTIIWAAIIPMINDALIQNNYTEIIEENFSYHWACMDGCFNMLEVEYGEVDYDNETLKEYHHECSDKCYEMYIGDLE